MKKVIILFIALLSVGAQAQTTAPAQQKSAVTRPPVQVRDGGGAHGGVGIYLGGRVFLLDLVEAGVQKDPFFDPAITTRPDFQVEIDRALVNLRLKPKVRELIAKKLSEVDRVSRSVALQLLLGMKSYSWRMVDPRLMPTYDERTAILREGARFQIASRTARTIMISKKDADLLDDANLAALIFHEIFFAFTSTGTTCASRQPNGDCHLFAIKQQQTSDSAQAATGFVFSVELRTAGIGTLKRILARIEMVVSDDKSPYLMAQDELRVSLNSSDYVAAISVRVNKSNYGSAYFSGESVSLETTEQWCGVKNQAVPDSGSWSIFPRQYTVDFVDYEDVDGPRSRLSGTSVENNKRIAIHRVEAEAWTGPVDCSRKLLEAFHAARKGADEMFIP